MGIDIIVSGSGGGGGGGDGDSSVDQNGPALSTYTEIHRYEFNDSSGDFVDAVGDEDISPLGGAWTYGNEGLRGDCMTTGTNSYGLIDSEGYAPEGTGAEYTLNFWMNIPSVSGRAFGWFLDNGSQSNMIAVYFNNGSAHLQHNNSSKGVGPDGSILAGVWHMITMMRDSTATKLFIDGVEYVSFSDSGWDTDLTDWELVLGKSAIYYNLSGAKWDQGRYYAEAISVTALRELYNKGRGYLSDDADPVLTGTYISQYAASLTHAFKCDGAGDDLVNALAGGENAILESGTATFEATGKNGNAVSCTTNPYWSLTNGPLRGVGTGKFSINMWIKITTSSGTKQIITITGNIASFGSNLYVEANSSRQVILRGTSTTAQVTSDALVLDQWHMITIVRGEYLTKMYLDGVSQGVSNAFDALDVGEFEIWLGRATTNYGSNLDRDEILVFHDELSDPAIDELWNDGDGLFVGAA